VALFAGSLSVARYREAVTVAEARIARLNRQGSSPGDGFDARSEPWDIEGDFFQRGLALDSRGCGAGYARIAVAARVCNPEDAAECARRALASNPEAWRPWYEAFIGAAESATEYRIQAGWRANVLRCQ
jgi:hypothetical protein